VFRGASAITVDAKGRMAMPARYRTCLSENCEGQLIATIDSRQACLLLYPLNEWEIIERKLSQLSDMVPAERALKRLLIGHAHECDMDKNGRLLIPSLLRDYAALEKNVMLVGQFNKFEIWSDIAWNAQIQQDLQLNMGAEADSPRLSELSL
jgi:MraZ protein